VSRVHIVLEEVATLRAMITEIQKTQNKKDDSKLNGQIDNINDFLGKQRSWLMEKFRACSTGALNHSTVETHLKDYPGLRMAVSTFSSVTQSDINMDEYMEKYSEWVKAGLAHACNEAVNISSLMNPRQYKEYHVNPPTYVKNLPVTPQNKYFKIINKETNRYLYSDSDNALALYPSICSHMPPGHLTWTLEPVN
jgi:glutamate synthase domain-containing protein 2